MPLPPRIEDEPFAWMTTAEPARRRLPAWLLSCILHASLVLLLALLVRDSARGVVAEPIRSAGIVLTQNTGRQAEYFSDSDLDSDQQAEDDVATEATDAEAADSTPPAVAALPAADQVPFELSGILPESGPIAGIGPGADWSSALPSADRMTAGPGPSRSLGKGDKTYLFGTEGEGSLFVYVFDRSDSMNGYEGRPLAAAKAELVNSIKLLKATSQFQIIFYNNEVTAFQPNPGQQPRLMFADDGTKALAERFVRQLPALGSTEHMKPLQLALRLAPDVIFFLTDAADPQLSARQLDQLRRMNAGTVIHTIEFGPGPFAGGDNFLMKLARQNNGRHTYVDVTRLPGRSSF